MSKIKNIPGSLPDTRTLYYRYMAMVNSQLEKVSEYPDSVLPKDVFTSLTSGVKMVRELELSILKEDADKQDITLEQKLKLKELLDNDPELRKIIETQEVTRREIPE